MLCLVTEKMEEEMKKKKKKKEWESKERISLM
jgi:hypothetical protein